MMMLCRIRSPAEVLRFFLPILTYMFINAADSVGNRVQQLEFLVSENDSPGREWCPQGVRRFKDAKNNKYQWLNSLSKEKRKEEKSWL